MDRLVAVARGNGVNELELRIGVSQVLILIAFMFSFVLAMSAAFLAAPAIASDVETGTVHAMLARPMHRADLVVGRWLGLGDHRGRRTRRSRACSPSASSGWSAGYSPPSIAARASPTSRSRRWRC